MGQGQTLGNARGDGDRPVDPRRDDPVDALRLGEPRDVLLVLGGDDRATVREREADGGGVAVGRDDEEPAVARTAQQPDLRGSSA